MKEVSKKFVNNLRYLCLVSVIALGLIAIVGTGGGGGGGGSDFSSEPTLMISSSEAVPGSFITIEDDSIKEGDELNVTFDNTSGYEVTIKTILTEDGYAKVPVPPIVNLTTGNFTSSKVTVSIPSGGQATLNVLPLPELSGVAAGDVVKMYLAHTKSNLQTALENMDQFSSEFSYDTSELEQQIQTQINTLETSINEIETFAQMSMYSFYDGEIILDQNDLGKLDQLLFAVLKGVMEENAITASAKIQYRGISTVDELGDELENVYITIQNSKIVLVGAGGMVVTIAGAVIGPQIAAGTTILYALQAAGASILVVGTASEGMAAIESVMNEGHLNSGEVYMFGNEYLNEFVDGLKNMGLAAGSEVNGVVNLLSFLDTRANVKNAITNLICNADPVPSGYEEYCKEWDAEHKPTSLSISPISFYPRTIAPGVEGELGFCLTRSDVSSPVSVQIDWGDDEEKTYFGSGGGFHTTKHTFYLSNEKYRIFTIKAHAIDDAGNEAWANTKVLVTKDQEPSVTFSNIPQRIKTNDNRSWGITISGGKSPYDYTMSWGDGSVKNDVLDKMGDIALNHTYTAANIYTVRMDVTDANKLSASMTHEADVRDPVSIATITGPTVLDLGDPGTWTVGLDGGWGPYVGSINWGDSVIRSGHSQTRQFTISHTYTEIGTYTFLVTITDDEGDMDNKGFTVEVSKTERSFTFTLTGSCIDSNIDLTRNGTITVNDDDTITLSTSGITETTELIGNNFTITLIQTVTHPDEVLVFTEIFEGTIKIDESTGVMTGSGKYTSEMSDGSISCTGTWTSD